MPSSLPDLPWFGTAPREAAYLAGISGGADSVALLHLLAAHGFRSVVVCHLNHGLRGEEADGDASFVKELAAQLGYPCEIESLDVMELSKQQGHSLETAARHARHAFFARCAARHGCSTILLGHHRDDQAETVLWNLLRGSRGLSGMKEAQTVKVGGMVLELRRPLLDVTRPQLREWLMTEGHEWREDATNAEPFAVRNRLRNEALPLLEDIAKRNVADALVKAAESTAELLEIQEWAIAKAGVIDPQGRLHLPALRELPPALQSACLHAYLKNAGVPDLSREVVNRCLALLDPGAAYTANLPGGHIFHRRQGRAFVIGTTAHLVDPAKGASNGEGAILPPF